MASFIGTFTNRIDRKGRVSVPARFRAALAAPPAAGAFNGVVVAPNGGLGAIDACDRQRIEDTIDRLDARDGLTAEEQEAIELVLSDSEELPFDGEGRIILPERLIALAGIEDKAVFVGIGRVFQVWSPERREAWKSEASEGPLGRIGLKDLWSLGAGGGA
ncbi:MAG: division/cell wall cluster transcriptional repressor MraZ [Rhodospirillaceae bacterium]|nr:division/cell wall cluster transcriptional repressor MraZ [Rhodospirillaceae bacterium]